MEHASISAVVEGMPSAGPTPWLVRLCAGVPYLAAAAVLSAVFGGYIGGDIRLTAEVHHASSWLLFELLACVYATLLPLGLILVGIVRALLRRPRRDTRRDGSLLLLIPFGWLAWTLAPEGVARWGLVIFLVLAFARWIPHRHNAALVRDGILAVAGGARSAVRVWSFFTASFLLSAFFILPLEPLLGLEMPSVEHGQYFLFLGGGIVYFLLNAVFELFDLARRLFPPHRRLRNPLTAALDDEAARGEPAGLRVTRGRSACP